MTPLFFIFRKCREIAAAVRSMGWRHVFSQPYVSQSSGVIEREIRTILEGMVCLAAQHHAFAFNTTIPETRTNRFSLRTPVWCKYSQACWFQAVQTSANLGRRLFCVLSCAAWLYRCSRALGIAAQEIVGEDSQHRYCSVEGEAIRIQFVGQALENRQLLTTFWIPQKNCNLSLIQCCNPVKRSTCARWASLNMTLTESLTGLLFHLGTNGTVL